MLKPLATQPGQPSMAPESGALEGKRPYTVECVRSEEDLLGLRDDWNRLSTTSKAGLFSSFEWVTLWWRYVASGSSFPGAKKLMVLTVRTSAGITGIAPFMVRTPSRSGLGVRKVEFIGSTFNDYNDVLLDGDQERQIGALADSLAAHAIEYDLMDLRGFPENSEAPQFLTRAMEKVGLKARMRPDEPCPFVALTSDWEGMLRSFSRSARLTLHNQANRLRRGGEEGLCVRIIENPQNEPALLRRMAEVESAKQVKGAPSALLVAAFPEFFQGLMTTFGSKGELYIAVMEQTGRLAAYQLGFCTGQRLWDYTTAFDPAFAKWSPGTMLVPEIINYGFRKNLREFDFLRGDEPYKRRFAKSAHVTWRVQAWKKDWESRLKAALYFELRPFLYRLPWAARLGLPYTPQGEV